jgi:hypothetical protein
VSGLKAALRRKGEAYLTAKEGERKSRGGRHRNGQRCRLRERSAVADNEEKWVLGVDPKEVGGGGRGRGAGVDSGNQWR